MAHGAEYSTPWATTVQGNRWRHSGRLELLVSSGPGVWDLTAPDGFRWSVHDSTLPLLESEVASGYAPTILDAQERADRTAARIRAL